MGRRYYCDFCDKLFIDDIDARKKHLSSSHHLKLRKAHYDSFRDIATVLKEESKKIPCRRFQTSGFCQFETMCKYTHYTPEELWQMQQTYLAMQHEKQCKQYESEKIEVPSADDWLAKYSERKKGETESVNVEFWRYPSHLELRTDLPPSMRKFQPEDFSDSNFSEWGK